MDFSFPNLQSVPTSRPKTSPLDERIEVFVLTHGAKPSTSIATLTSLGIPFKQFSNPDWEFPADHPELQVNRSVRPGVRGYALRQYRAFKGHQAILAQADKSKYTLVFEDDMSLLPDVTPTAMLSHLNAAPRLLNRYDAVSFHARNQSASWHGIGLYGREYVELQPRQLQGQADWGHAFFLKPVLSGYNGKYQNLQFKWHEGCLAYMVNAAGRTKWINAGHGSGMPCDLFLANELNTIVLRETIFLHDERHGSLISGTVKK